MKIKKGDTVVVISGNDKGKKGEVISTSPKANKVVVKGVNIVKKHQKPKKQGEQGGIISLESAINECKVNVLCSKCGKPTRIGYKIESKEKTRICRKCGKEI